MVEAGAAASTLDHWAHVKGERSWPQEGVGLQCSGMSLAHPVSDPLPSPQ